MKYKDLELTVPGSVRPTVNKNVLYIVGSGDNQGVTPEEIYNSYTGIGGLHGLDFNEYRNRYDYTEAKKEYEQGQFFTPISLAKKIAGLIDLRKNELVCDATCGHGVFANFFTEENFYGCEIEADAYNVAKYLFPDSNIVNEDVRFYEPGVNFDYIIGNPPFNLKWEYKGIKYTSQDIYFQRCSAILRAAGLILAIVPQSYCSDEFFSKSEIERLNANFNFLFQVKLNNNAFKGIGVSNFPTKLICLQKVSEHLEKRNYTNTYINWNEAVSIFDVHKQLSRDLRIKANAENISTDTNFDYKIRKYLFELKTHKHLSKEYTKVVGMIEKFQTQACPKTMEYAHWHKYVRISPESLLRNVKRVIANQYHKPQEKICLIKSKNTIYFKAYSPKTEKQKNKQNEYQKVYNINDIILNDNYFGDIPLKYKGYYKLIKRKQEQYKIQNTRFHDIEIPTGATENVKAFTWLNIKKEVCRFNDMQVSDLSKVFTKQYSILNWQQGSGKTAGAYAWSKYFTKAKKTFVVSGALSINITWTKFLKTNGQSFVTIKSLADIAQIPNVDYVLISHYFMIQYEKQINRAIKILSRKVSMILDESDEITNHKAKRSRAINNTFVRVKYKLLTTGTTTRNNILELYPQLNLLYNNSYNFACTCKIIYKESAKDKTISAEPNKNHYNKPFPAYSGNSLFRSCFNPSKATVFGISQQSQDLYNEEHLRNIIEKTIITRKFKEIAGDKYAVHSIPVRQNDEERTLYRKIIREFEEMVYIYYESTGNARKDALLKIIRQIQLLIKATSTPTSFQEYTSNLQPNKTKRIMADIKKIDDKIAIGCTTIDAVDYYTATIRKEHPARPLFIIQGDVPFKTRDKIITEFQATANGILVSTQQSLKSSVNIPECNNVFIESLQWNIPTIEQFYFRFIRYDSSSHTNVYFYNYHDTIEVNLLALLMAKEKLNDYIKTLEYRDNSDIYSEYDIDLNILQSLITKEKDEDGKMQLKWGQGTLC